MSDGPGGLVFSDLDGTLLDHETYSWEAARPGLEALAARGVPLVPCTSKTLAELRVLAAAMGLSGPGIVENGAAICWDLRADGEVEVLGRPYEELRAALHRIRSELGLPLVGFGDLDADGVAQRTGLDPESAARARQRHGDEPFWAEPELTKGRAQALADRAMALGYGLTRGGRFYHLTGGGDKGSAARRVIAQLRPARTAAFGDAANDRPLLEAVDRPFAVRRPNGRPDPELAELAGVTVTEGLGPAGFYEGVERLLAEGFAGGA